MATNQPVNFVPDHEGLGLASALSQSLVGRLIFVDWEAQTARLTRGAQEMLGFKAAPGSTIPLSSLPGPLVALAKNASASPQETSTQQIRLPLPRRGSIWAAVTAAGVATGPTGRVTVLVMTDLSATQTLQQHIHQLDRLASLGTLAASTAHEIKNALVAGRSLIDLVLERNRDDELAGIVRREIDRIDAIVSRMLRFAGPAKGSFGPLSVHEVLEYSLQLVQPQLDGKAIGVTKSYRATPDLVEGNEYELQQVFLNLSLNALEAMGPSGRLTIATELVPAGGLAAKGDTVPKPARLRITVQDDGPGISEEDQLHLFEPFHTTKPNGTGLGLAITRRILQEHRGTIAVNSEPGQGTTFTIDLPAPTGNSTHSTAKT